MGNYAHFVKLWAHENVPTVPFETAALQTYENRTQKQLPASYVDQVSQTGAVSAFSYDFDTWVEKRFPDAPQSFETSLLFFLTSENLLESADWDWELNFERTKDWTSKLAPFAKTGIGDCLCFAHKDLRSNERVEAPVYFWDIHADCVYQLASTFDDFLAQFLE